MEHLPSVQIAIVQVVNNGTRTIASTKRCSICDALPEPHELVMRIRDLAPGRPGIHETVMHVSCAQALMNASDPTPVIGQYSFN